MEVVTFDRQVQEGDTLTYDLRERRKHLHHHSEWQQIKAAYMDRKWTRRGLEPVWLILWLKRASQKQPPAIAPWFSTKMTSVWVEIFCFGRSFPISSSNSFWGAFTVGPVDHSWSISQGLSPPHSVASQPNRISKRRIWKASIGLFFDFFWILKSWRTNEFPVSKVHSFIWSWGILTGFSKTSWIICQQNCSL